MIMLPNREGPESSWSVSQISKQAAQLIKQGLPNTFWMIGVLSGYRRDKGKNCRFFTLIDLENATVSVSAVVFEAELERITRTLRSSGSRIDFRDGLPVRFLVSADLWVGAGKFQLKVRDVDPWYSAAALELKRTQVLTAIKEMGIQDWNTNLPMPLLPLRIALVTSASGEAKHDFESGLKSEPANYRVELFDVRVQGEGLEGSVLQALSWIERRSDEFDVVCIIRGGGSEQDLSWFDNLAVAEAVCRLPVKVVVGIGHERDRTVLDDLAFRVKTPTAAATMIVEAIRLQKTRLAKALAAIRVFSHQAVVEYGQEMVQRLHRLRVAATLRLYKEESKVDDSRRQIVQVTKLLLRDKTDALEAAVNRLRVASGNQFRSEKERFDYMERTIQSHARQLALPGKERFAIVNQRTRAVVTSCHQVKTGDSLSISLPDGVVYVTVNRVEEMEGGIE